MMGSTRLSRRNAVRCQRRPDLEALEVRTLLSTGQGIGSQLDNTPNAVATSAPGTSVRPADGAGGGSTTNFDAIIGASAARKAYQVDGSGLTVAVIDTGVNYKHEALGGAIGPGHKVVAGVDFTDPNGDGFARTLDHGTSVAGLIASDDPAHQGVAPGADVVALRVFDDSNTGDFNRVATALQWVIDHHDQYHISAVNLSLSDGQNYAHNWFALDGGIGQRLTDLVSQLDKLNIPVMTAAGNSFNGQQGVGFTGIIADSIDVTSTDAADHLVANAQRLGADLGGDSATDVAAPGVGLTAPVSGNSFADQGGTSFSTALVSGAVVLLQQVYESRFGHLPSVSDLDSWIKGGADPAVDPVTHITIGRLDIPRSIGLIPNPAAQMLTPPTTPPPVVTTPPPVVLTPPPPVTTPPVAVTPPATTMPPPAIMTPPPVATKPPPAVTTPPPVASSPPPVATTPPPATNPPASNSSGGSELWAVGSSTPNVNLNQGGTNLSGFSSWVVQTLQSLKDWWTGPTVVGSSNGQTWSSPAPAGAQPAGSVAMAQPRVHIPMRHPHARHTPNLADRSWHSFVAPRQGR